MPRDGTQTRTRIMDAAEALILENGYSATSVDKVIRQAGITKGTFFYHFESKLELAVALVDRFARLDLEVMETNLARADALSRDPLQRLLIFIGLYREEMARLTEPYPGCLYASFVYEAGLIDERTRAIIERTVREWRRRLGERLHDAAAQHPPRIAVDLDSLADMLTVAFEGAFIVSKIVREPQVVADQLSHLRNYIELVFGAEG